MADINSPKEYLQEALEAVDSLNADRAKMEELGADRARKDRELAALSENIEQEKRKTVESRRSDLEKEFSKKLKAADSQLEKIGERRAKAREAGVKTRVETQTAGFKGEIANLKAQLYAYCKENRLPVICRSRLFYKLFSPKHASDWLLMIIIAAIMVGALWASVEFAERRVYFIAVLAVDVLIIVIYAVIFANTAGKHHNELKVCRQIVDAIINDEKGVRTVTKNIRRDKDDSQYDLGSFDEEINAKKQEIAGLEAQKTSALYQFDNVTSQQLAAEIDSTYAARLAEAREASEAAKNAYNDIAGRVHAMENAISINYVQYIGSDNLNHDSILRMIELLESGEAVSVSDAAARLKGGR